MASPTQWTWIWASSGRQWRTEEAGTMQSIGSQRVGHDLLSDLTRTALRRLDTPLCRLTPLPSSWSTCGSIYGCFSNQRRSSETALKSACLGAASSRRRVGGMVRPCFPFPQSSLHSLPEPQVSTAVTRSGRHSALAFSPSYSPFLAFSGASWSQFNYFDPNLGL